MNEADQKGYYRRGVVCLIADLDSLRILKALYHICQAAFQAQKAGAEGREKKRGDEKMAHERSTTR